MQATASRASTHVFVSRHPYCDSTSGLVSRHKWRCAFQACLPIGNAMGSAHIDTHHHYPRRADWPCGEGGSSPGKKNGNRQELAVIGCRSASNTGIFRPFGSDSSETCDGCNMCRWLRRRMNRRSAVSQPTSHSVKSGSPICVCVCVSARPTDQPSACRLTGWLTLAYCLDSTCVPAFVEHTASQPTKYYATMR